MTKRDIFMQTSFVGTERKLVKTGAFSRVKSAPIATSSSLISLELKWTKFMTHKKDNLVHNKE